MKQLSSAFIQALNDDEREYLAYATIQLMDGTTLNLTNEEIWSGGFRYEESVSDDNTFTAVGSAIMGSATLIINNIYDDYTNYDFTNARVSLSVGIVDAEDILPIGEYRVDDTSYNGATIQLTLLDNMGEFDRPYSLSTLNYPVNIQRIVYHACLDCGVSPDRSAIAFPNNDYYIRHKPTEENVTYRDVISWVAAIAGCFARINSSGKLEFKWFNVNALDAIDTTSPTYHPWDDGELYSSSGVHYLYSLTSQNICTDDVVITGVTIRVKTEDDENTESDILSYSYNSSGYVDGELENDGSEYIILVENNGFITKNNAVQIVTYLGTQLVGLRFRKLNISQISDPSIEAGDVAIVTDRKLNSYKTLITRNAFGIGSSQTIVCGADTPSKSNATSNSDVTKSYVEARKLFKKSVSVADDALNSAIIAAQAAYEAQESADSALNSAKSANNSANSALTQLSVVEDVAGTLNWIRENAEFVITEDVKLNPNTVYFIYENGEYVPVVAPDINVNPKQEGWYVLDVASSQSEYIMAHLAVTSAGLWVLPFNTLAPHPLIDSANYNLIDSDENQLVDFSKDPQNADGYKVLLASDGMTVYNADGTSVANYGTTARIGAEAFNHIYIDSDSVDIKRGEDILATFDENGMIVYRTVNGNTMKVATFKADSYSGYPKLELQNPIYSTNSVDLDVVDLTFNVPNDPTYFPPNPNSFNGIYKARYGRTGIYYNDHIGSVGGVITSGGSSYSYPVASGTWDIVDQAGGISEGTYLIIFGAGFASNSSGYRRIVLNNSLSGTPSATRYDISSPAVNGVGTNFQGVKVVTVTGNNNDGDFYLWVYQNSGSELTVYPFIKIIRLV